MKRLSDLLHEEDGQALLYGVGVIVIIAALFFGAVDLGRLMLGKMQSQNAADAAALSAASLKAGLHNTRALAYRAASGQLTLSRMKLIEATGLALQEIGKPNSNPTAYKNAVRAARGHRLKLEKLRDGLLKFNRWATDASQGPEATRQAAEIGYLGNIGSLGSDSYNMHLFDDAAPLAESGKKAPGAGGQGYMAGGVTYPGEALTATGNAGKSWVRISPTLGAFGGSWLNYGDDDSLYAEAVAGSMLAKHAYGKNPPGLEQYGINWYTVRLMPIGGRQDRND